MTGWLSRDLPRCVVPTNSGEGGRFLREELNLKATKPSVLGLADHTHPAYAEFFDDAVVRDLLVDHSRRILRRRSGASRTHH